MQNESRNIYEITNKIIWDDFVTSQKNHTFLHSWAWGAFNEAMGNKIWRLGVYKDDIIIAAALLIKVRARRGDFLFVPQGPVFSCGENWANPKSPPPHKASEGRGEIRNPSSTLRDELAGSDSNEKQITNPKFQILKTFTEKFKEITKKEKANFIRISPLLEESGENRGMFKKLGFRDAPIHMHAEATWTLDLTPSEDELLMGMRKTTRNLIKRALKEGVEIKSGNTESDVAIFNNLYKETVARHNFTPFSLTYLKNQVKILSKTGEDMNCDIQVFSAYYNKEPIASAIIVFYGNSAFYHHGASSQKYSKIPATYLLQWGAIREAKRRGHKFYNFWGIVRQETNKKSPYGRSHPWTGITLFKKGFGGFQTSYIHAQDLPMSSSYWVNWLIETLRRKKRNL